MLSTNTSMREMRKRNFTMLHDTISSQHIDRRHIGEWCGTLRSRSRAVKFRRRVTARQCYGCEWACEEEKERKRKARSLAHSTSEGLPVVPQAKRTRAFSRAWLGMRPLPRSASRRSHGGTSSFLFTRRCPASAFRRRSIGARLARSSGRDRNDRARITCHRSIANTARQNGADPIRTWYATSITRVTSSIAVNGLRRL